MAAIGLNAIQDQETGRVIAQMPLPPIKYAVLEGGGVRGAAYAGTFNILNKYGMLRDIEHVAASSVGTIAALFLALGYTPEEARKEFESISLKDFMEGSDSWSWTPSTFSMVRKGLSIWNSPTNSLSSGKKLHEWLQSIVEKKLGKKDATFEDLQAAVESAENKNRDYPFKYLHMMATNISLPVAEGEVFSHEYQNKRKCPLALAALASSAFPGAFPRVEWDGFEYIDGGMKANLPSTLFDKERYLPEGYGFTEKGQNPSVLAIKIDTKDEINQLIWGERKKINVSGGSNFFGAVAVAGTETVDVAEIRESRMVLPLPDADIGTLDFTIDDEGKVRLVSTAEKVTEEFFENHVDAAYSIKVYDNQRAWLDSLSLDDLAKTIQKYKLLEKKCLRKQAKMPAEADDATFDLDNLFSQDPESALKNFQEMLEPPIETDTRKEKKGNDNITDIQNYIAYLTKYYHYRHYQAIYPNTTFDKTPPKHVNLKPEIKKDGWQAKVKEDMLKRLKVIERRIVVTNDKINNNHFSLKEYYDNSPQKNLHDENIFEKVKVLTGYIEYRKVLEEEQLDLQKKLDIKTNTPTTYTANPHYSAFIDAIKTSLEDDKIPPALKAILQPINLFEPIIAYKPSHKGDSAVFTLELRNEQDFKLFMHAALLYLKDQKCENTVLTPELFQGFYPDDEIPPKDMVALCGSLGLEDINLLVANYRLEQLMHFFFKSQYPNKKPTLDLEQMLGGSDVSFFLNNKSPKHTAPPKGTLIALKTMYEQTQDHEYKCNPYTLQAIDTDETQDDTSKAVIQRPASPMNETTAWTRLAEAAKLSTFSPAVNRGQASNNRDNNQDTTPSWFFGRRT